MKHFLTLLFLVIITFSVKANAQEDPLQGLDDSDLSALEANMRTTSNIQKIDSEIKEIDRNLMIDLRDDDTGIAAGQYGIDKDASRYSLLLNLSADLTSLTNFTSFEFAYAKKLEMAWLEFFISKATVTFSEITDKNPNDLNLAGFPEDDLDLNKSDLLSFGVGLAYRTSWVQNLLPSDRFFETIAGHITLNQFTESLTAIKYNGFGIRADFGLHYRMNESFHIGSKLSYNLSTVRRSTDIDFNPEAVTSSQRSLTLNWISLGVDLSYYF